jgi:hypothetical protein
VRIELDNVTDNEVLLLTVRTADGARAHVQVESRLWEEVSVARRACVAGSYERQLKRLHTPGRRLLVHSR